MCAAGEATLTGSQDEKIEVVRCHGRILVGLSTAGLVNWDVSGLLVWLESRGITFAFLCPGGLHSVRQIHSEDHLKGRAEIGMEAQEILKRGLVPRYATRGLGRDDVHSSSSLVMKLI